MAGNHHHNPACPAVLLKLLTLTETLNSYFHYRSVTPNGVQHEKRAGAFLRPLEEMHKLEFKFKGLETWLLYAEQRDLTPTPGNP